MIVAIDIGTSSSKGCCFDVQTLRPVTDWVRISSQANEGRSYATSPNEWFEACLQIMNTLATQGAARNAKPVILVLSGMMQNVIQPFETHSSCVLYSDAVFALEAHERLVKNNHSALHRLKALTGNYKDSASIVAKLVQLNKLKPKGMSENALERRVLFGAHSYVAWRLMGSSKTEGWFCDMTTASTTGLMDQSSQQWIHRSLLEELGIDNFVLPMLLPDAARIVGTIRGTGGVFDGVPLVHGAGDLGSLICAVDRFNADTHAYIGTSGWIARVVPRGLESSKKLPVFVLMHPIDSTTKAIEAMPTTGAGLNINHWSKTVFESKSLQDFDRHAANAYEKTAVQNVLYLPYLQGERSPLSMPSATACFIGMTANTSKEDMALAILTGVAYQFRWLAESLELERGDHSELMLLGGGSHSDPWRQVIADVLGMNVKSLQERNFDETVFGAACIGQRALKNSLNLHHNNEVLPEGMNWVISSPKTNMIVKEHDLRFQQWKRAAVMLKDLFTSNL